MQYKFIVPLRQEYYELRNIMVNSVYKPYTVCRWTQKETCTTMGICCCIAARTHGFFIDLLASIFAGKNPTYTFKSVIYTDWKLLWCSDIPCTNCIACDLAYIKLSNSSNPEAQPKEEWFWSNLKYFWIYCISGGFNNSFMGWFVVDYRRHQPIYFRNKSSCHRYMGNCNYHDCTKENPKRSGLVWNHFKYYWYSCINTVRYYVHAFTYIIKGSK